MIRPAHPADVPAILGLVHALAEYEQAPDEVRVTSDQMLGALFGPAPAVFCHVAVDDETGGTVGFAVWFLTFSTWLGRHGIYLEDLFVMPAARRRGHGRALLTTLARLAVEREYGRLEWSVLDWNAPAQAFYRSLGAVPMDEWTGWRLTGAALARAGSPVAGPAPGNGHGIDPVG